MTLPAPIRGMGGRRLRLALLASTSLLAAATAWPARAQSVLPTQGTVASGAATITPSGSSLTIRQTSDRAVVNWNSFSIGAGASVTFAQPNAGSATLNRVTGATASTLSGALAANGQVYLVNPNGIAITRSGTVSVGGGFVASTLSISDKDFNDGKLHFHGSGASAAVSNAGEIDAAPGGFVSLLGGSVANSGVIDAPLGKVALGSGEQATLDLTGDGFLQVALPTNAQAADGRALVDVSGQVRAAGGRIALKAATAANAVRNAINLSGYVSARSAHAVGGSIVLDGGAGGDVAVSGRISASGRSGGTVRIAGASATLTGARVSAKGRKGRGGTVTATGSAAVALAGASLDVSGATGGGVITLGGPRGQATSTTMVDAASALRADALTNGNGGTIKVLSSGATTVAGLLTARGGARGGDGGAIETSGETAQLGGARIDTTAAHGATGLWTIDPTDFTIAASGGDITGAALSGELATTNVTIKSSQGASGTAGQINVNDAVSWSAATTLTLDAYANVVFNANMSVQGAGHVALITGDTAQSGAGSATTGRVQFAMTDLGPTASLSFANAASGLTINGVAYTLVQTEAGLAALGGNPTGSFALANDIALTGAYTTSVVNAFNGNFEGLGHKLSNLSLSPGVGSAQFVGFFGRLQANAAVSNVFLDNVNITGANATDLGALAGQSSGLIYNSGSSGTITGAGADLGGLVGLNNGLVQVGWSSAHVVGSTSTGNDVGGLIGYNAGGVAGGFASGNVQGDDYVGGVAGYSNGYVNAGSSGFISGNAYVGGVVGDNGPNDAGTFRFDGVGYGPYQTVEGAYVYGGVYGTLDAGGVAGRNQGTVRTSFSNAAVAGVTSVGGLVGENDRTLQTSYAIGGVSGTTNVGGLVGENLGAISSAFAMGAVRGTTNVGGLVGLEGGASATTRIADSYSTGAVSGETGATGVGGLVGAIGAGATDTITDAYWDTLTSGRTASAGTGPQGYTTAQLQGGATLTLAGFAGGATGGESNVYPYPTSLFPNGVRAISGIAYQNYLGTTPLTSSAAGAAPVYLDTAGSVKNHGTTGANGYYYIFLDPSTLAAGANAVVYTVAGEAAGAANSATYVENVTANNTTANILGDTFNEPTAFPTYSQLATAVTNATAGDGAAPGVLAGAFHLNITASAASFTIDQPISNTSDTTITGASIAVNAPISAADVNFVGPVALAANVQATGGVLFGDAVTLDATSVITAAETTFNGSITGATAGAGLTVTGGTVQLYGNVATNNGAMDFAGPVVLNTNVTLNAGTASVAFGSTLDSSGDSFSNGNGLTASAGAFSFGGAVGSQFALGALSLTSTAALALPAVDATSILARTTGAGAGLTLNGVLTASGNGTAVTLESAGPFNNTVGSGAIVLTGDPQWLIYLASPTGNIYNGLDSGNYPIWNTPYPGTGVAATGNYYVFAYQPTVTFTSINDAKTYGQDVTTRVATDYTVSGLQPAVAGAYLGGSAAGAYTGAPSVTSTGSATSATVAGSPYGILVGNGALAAVNGYALAFASPGELSVGREAITVTASANSKTYDSTTTAAALPTVTTGTLYDAATLAETYATPNAGTGLTLNPTVAFSNPSAAGNYTVTLAASQNGVITPEAITVTASANSKTYDSTTSAAALPTVTTGTLYDPATLSETYGAPNAGRGLTLNPAVAFANPAVAGDYAVTLAPAAVGVINPEPITVTAVGATKTFDGTTAAPATPLLTTGRLFDPATLSETYASPYPGSGIVLTPAIAFAAPTTANNYLVTLVPTGTTPPNTGVILPPGFPLDDSPSVFVNRQTYFDIPGAASACGVELQLPDVTSMADPIGAANAIADATSRYLERCKDASQTDIADALDRYADALQIVVERLAPRVPPKLRQELLRLPAIVHAAAARARVAPTRAAAVRVMQQTVAIVRREISLVRAEDPDSARIRAAVAGGATRVLGAAAVSLARAEGI